MTLAQTGFSVRSTNQFSLLRTQRFAPYFATQCLGALNDNLLRNGLVMLVTFGLLPNMGSTPSILANILGAVFILPFVLFSSVAGQLADRADKSRLLQSIKLSELGLMAVACAMLWWQTTLGLIVLVFAMGLQSTMFGPVKYAILPDLVRRSELTGANGLVEGGTYLAIIIGLYAGGFFASLGDDSRAGLGVALLVVAAVGYGTSRAIPKVAAADPTLQIDFNLWRHSRKVVGFSRERRDVFAAILALSWFWTIGFIVLAQLPGLSADVLRGTPQLANTLLVCFAVGIGAGSLLCEKLSSGDVDTALWLVPVGALGLTLFTADIGLGLVHVNSSETTNLASFIQSPGNWRLLADLTFIGLSGGLFSVPLYSMIQDRTRSTRRSQVIAANNILNSVAMMIGALAATALLVVGAGITDLYLLCAIVNTVIVTAIAMTNREFAEEIWRTLRRKR
ncbi:MAG: MFS transporter [Pseudomonadota bacterium]